MQKTTKTIHSETPKYHITIKRYFLHRDDGKCIVSEDVFAIRKTDHMRVSYENRPYDPPDIEKLDYMYSNIDQRREKE